MVAVRTHHIGGNRHRAAFGDPHKTKIKGVFFPPAHGRDHPHAFAGKICAAPAVAEDVVELEHRSHFRVDAKVRREHGAIAPQLFNVAVRALPNPLKFVVVEEKVHHPFQKIIVLQLCTVKANQPQVFKVRLGKFCLGDEGDFPNIGPIKLIAQQERAGTVIVVFLCHK